MTGKKSTKCYFEKIYVIETLRVEKRQLTRKILHC